MAKFKVGDRVEITAGSKRGKTGKVETSAPGPQGGEMYHIRLDDGTLTDAAERNLTIANAVPCRSTNAVVQNALNATARNAAGDAEAERMWNDFQRKIAGWKREAEAMRQKFRSMKAFAEAEQMGYVIEKIDDAIFK